MDNIFYITLIFVFGAALISFVIQRWALDRCLKHFSNFHVSIEQEGQDPVWGGDDMGWCVECHRRPDENGEQQASTDCAVCHY